jgi:hypothetical protein
VLITTTGRSQMPSDAQHSGTVRYTVEFLEIHHAHQGTSTHTTGAHEQGNMDTRPQRDGCAA